MQVKIYHNPRCSKSRQTLALLQERNISPVIIDYLRSPPDAKELRQLLKILDISASSLIRKGQPEFTDLGLSASETSDEDLINAMVSTPILIERPIVVNGERARIGRPPEAVLEIL